MKILVAHDGSDYADRMLDDLRYAGLPPKAEVRVLSVAERWLPGDEDANSPERRHGHDVAQAWAEKAARHLAEVFPLWSVHGEGWNGSPAHEIVEQAKTWGAHLIAAGAAGHSLADRILIGSVSYKVANEAHCSVRICRGRGPGHNGAIRVVLAYDGMAGSDAAVKAVAARAWPAGSSVRLVTCVGFGYSPAADLSLREDFGRARAIQQSAERLLQSAGLHVQPVVLEGDPKLAIVDEAHRYSADSVFLGHNDRGMAYGLFIGTVASAVIPRARCSVEIVRQ